MLRRCHAAMGRFLRHALMPELPGLYAGLFLIGCAQPDQNPVACLKSFLRCQWQWEQNYDNSGRYLIRLTERLEGKTNYSFRDYYSLGRLIHCAMDAFTAPHNAEFGFTKSAGRYYEKELNTVFLSVLAGCEPDRETIPCPCSVWIQMVHDAYLQFPCSAATDTDYSLRVCCNLIQSLLPQSRLADAAK